MSDKTEKTITTSLDQYLEMDRKAADWDSIAKRMLELEKKYRSAMQYLEQVAPMRLGAVVLRTADRLLAYYPHTVPIYQYEIKIPIMPTLEAVQVAREDLVFEETKWRIYRATYETTSNGLRVYEEVRE